MYFVFSFKACFLLEICIFLSPINTNHCSGGVHAVHSAGDSVLILRVMFLFFKIESHYAHRLALFSRDTREKSINIIIKKKSRPQLAPPVFSWIAMGSQHSADLLGALAAASQSQGCDWLRRRPTDELRQLCRVAGLPIPAFPSPGVFFLFCTMWHSRFPSRAYVQLCAFSRRCAFVVGWGGAGLPRSCHCAQAMSHTVHTQWIIRYKCLPLEMLYIMCIYIYKYVTSWAWSGGVG